ncbi:hypothetical protein AQZ52_08580 [Novosphingobium fuchskuhlense]|uniref:Uncharacterized protein n=2 Tax=Novosphingobium fuchskuhlense TaxID=1117702 RepID=A0A124JUW1_9SPHN|nr:hypothetical protein AQZ52_08580 [Novosphingobium fuchskuhlense]
MNAPSIADGSRNTISVTAIGASASVSNSSVTFQDVEMTDSVDGNITVSASNLNSTINVSGTIDGAVIEQGHDNTISVSAVGASAQFSVTDDVLGGATVSRSLTVNGDISLNADNTGDVNLQIAVGSNGDGVSINGGTRNAFSGTALGASAGISVLTIVDDGTYSSDIGIGVDSGISVHAHNSGNIRIGSVDDPTQDTTLNGATISGDSVDSSISLMAIGASGSVNSTTVVYAGSAVPSVNFGVSGSDGGSDVPSVAFGDVNFDVENTGLVEANVSITGSSFEGKNSVSAGAIGVTMGNSVKFINYTGEAVSFHGTYGEVNYSVLNTAPIRVSGGMDHPAIPDGFGISWSANAIGAAASFSL